MDRSSSDFVDPTAGPLSVLLVDDDRNLTDSLRDSLRHHGFDIATAESCAAARTAMRDRSFDLVVLDLLLPDGNGLELLDDRRDACDAGFVVVTGHATVPSAVKAFKRGARDFLTKPVDPSQLASDLREIHRARALPPSARAAAGNGARSSLVGSMVGRSAAIQEVFAQVASVAGTDVRVLVHGERGTGKELLARVIHESSRRRDGPFVPVRCGAVSQALVESELFGCDHGASPVGPERLGFLERARGGTLFLDEVTEMAPSLQNSLLHALEAGSFRRMHGTRTIPVDARIVTSTSADVVDAVEKRLVRRDLLFRLSEFSIRLPALREREGDVAALAEHFLARLNLAHRANKAWAPGALDELARRDWSRNVRELEGAVGRAFLRGDDVLHAREVVPEIVPTTLRDGALPPDLPGSSIDKVERTLLLATLEHVKDDKPAAAMMLGISLRTLDDRLNSYRQERT